MKFMRKYHVWTTLVALVLVAGLSVPGAMAYFTTFVTAAGDLPVALDTMGRIDEKFDNAAKHISLKNTGNQPSFVRAIVFSPEFPLKDGVKPKVTVVAGSNWEKKGDYYEYKKVLSPGEMTDPSIYDDTKAQDPADLFDVRIESMDKIEALSFDLYVGQECTAVLYRADGTPYAQWGRTLTGGGK